MRKHLFLSGILVTSKDTERFDEKVSGIITLLSKQVEIYQDEEKALRVLREEEAEELDRVEREKRKKRKQTRMLNVSSVKSEWFLWSLHGAIYLHVNSIDMGKKSVIDQKMVRFLFRNIVTRVFYN